MKLKKRRSLEVPPKIKCFINRVTATPLEKIEEPLQNFLWEFDKGDFHHWVDLFNHFDSFFEKHIKPRNDLQLEDNFLDADPPFPREAVLQILRVIRIILENCTNKHLYKSYERHLSYLLASTDPDVIEACLQTLAAFLKKTIGKYSIRDASLSSKLFAFAQGWGGKEEGLGLIASSVQNGCDPVAYELGCTLHFEFYAVNNSSDGSSVINQERQGLQIIHLSNVDSCPMADLELLNKLVTEHKVPPDLRFSLLTRLRFSRAFGSLASRQQYTCIRLYAFIVLVQASNEANDLVSFFHSEPEFVNELVSILSYEDAVPEKIRHLCLLSLVALAQDRSRQPTVLAAVTSGGHRGILSSLMQKAIDSVLCDCSKWPIVFAEALLSLVTVLVSSSSGCSAMREAGFIPSLLPLIKDTNQQHLHLVGTAVQILEAFMDYSNPAALLFRELGGLEDTICRLKIEVSCVEACSKQQGEDPNIEGGSLQITEGASSNLDSMGPLYSDALVSYHRRLLMKALLRAISLGTYAPGNTSRICGSEESVLPECLSTIFRRAKDFGGGVFSLAATVMSDLIHKDPTCYAVLDEAGLPAAFLDAIMDGIVCSAEAIMSIPQCLDALCLNNNGLQAVKDRNSISCFVKIFTSKGYLRALSGEATGSLSSGLDELMRHASSLRGPGVDVLIEILNCIAKIGSDIDPSCSVTDIPSCSTPVPMETDTEEKSLVASNDDVSKMECVEQASEQASDSVTENVDSFLPDLACNVARLLETILQNADTCRIFIEKKGVEAVMKLFTLPLMPLSAQLGQSVSVAFKNFSPQHSALLARTMCSFLREHVKLTNSFLASTGGAQLVSLESAEQMKVLRCLSGLDGMLSLCIFLLKGTTAVISELSSADADVLKDLGRAYREIIWQVSLCDDSKVDEKQHTERENEGADGTSSSSAGRESDDDVNTPAVRYMNPVSTRNGSQPVWGADQDFLSALRSGEGFHRRGRHGLAHIRGGRAGRHLDALNIDPEVHMNVTETSPPEMMKKSPDVLVLETLSKLASTMRTFFSSIVKSFTSPNRRRGDIGSLSSATKILGTTLGKVFLEALGFSGYCTSGLATSPSVKCRYLGKVVNDMGALIFDSRRGSCYAVIINSFYVHETFKELLTTFEATSQLLWTPPYLVTSGVDNEKEDGGHKLSHSSWLLETLKCYCRVLEYFVNSSLLLSPTSTSQAQLLVQPAAVGLSIGLFPVPRNPEAFVRILQVQVLDVILPVWNHQMFPNCCPGFVASIVSLVTHIYSGVGDIKRDHNGVIGSGTQRSVTRPLDESTIETIVEMGFTRTRAEEALRRVETNSVEMAMEWLFSHPEDPVQEDDELARALALSLGSSAEGSKVDNSDKSEDVSVEEGQLKAPPVDDILAASLKLFQTCDTLAFSLADLFVTLCNRSKGEDRLKVATYLIQQLNLCPLDFSTDRTSLCMLSHALALLLYKDESVRCIACQKGIIPVVVHILVTFMERNEFQGEILAPKCISSLLLILDNMLLARPRIASEAPERTQIGSLPDASAQVSVLDERLGLDNLEKEFGAAVDNIMGKPTGYLTLEESQKVLVVACGLMKHRIPPMVMQADLQLCAHLTKTHSLALQFLDNGGLVALLSLPSTCYFPGYDTVASSIIRHLLEDPQTLQTSMELEIRQTFSGNRNSGRISPRAFLTSMAPVICRDPTVFMKAVTAVCHLESSGGRNYVVLSKEKEKDKDKSKAVIEDSIKISENKVSDGVGKCTKGHKKVPANLAQVIDPLLDIVLSYCSEKCREEIEAGVTSMEVDEPTKAKGKSVVDGLSKLESEFERFAGLAKVTFVLKFLSDILLMYGHAVGVILRRDMELCQLRGSNPTGDGGLLHHVLHQLLPISSDKSALRFDRRKKLSEKASWFLVVLCSRSGEARRRLVVELVKAMSAYFNVESNSANSILLPDKKVFAFADLVFSLLSTSALSSNLPGSGFSTEMAKSMIDGGMVQCLSGLLQVIDLDHPDASKIVNLIVKALESLTRAVNNAEQVGKSEVLNKRKSIGSNGRLDDHTNVAAVETAVANQNSSGTQEGGDVEESIRQQGNTSILGDNAANQSTEQDMGIEVEETTETNQVMESGADFMHEEVEDGVLHNEDQIEMTFQVENRADDDMGEEDDDMGDDDEDDEDIAEEGGGMMSLGDTDAEDHDDPGLGDGYNDDVVDEDDEDFHEGRVFEVRWREALDGLDRLQVLGQPGAANSLLDVGAEPFEGVNVDDLFGLRRPLGFDRQRQSSRSSFEQSLTEVNGFQHPLLLRPSQSVDVMPSWSSAGHSSRGLESSPSGTLDVAQFYMFDAPVLPFDHISNTLVADRLGPVGPSLGDYSVTLDSMQMHGRRGSGGSRWTDDGQPQAGSQAAVIAQVLEEQFLSEMRSISPPSDAARQYDTELQDNQPPVEPSSTNGQLVMEDNNRSSQHTEVPHGNGEEVTCGQLNLSAENVPHQEHLDSGILQEGENRHEAMAVQSISLNSSPNRDEGTEMGCTDGIACELSGILPGTVNTSSENLVAVFPEGLNERPPSHPDVAVEALGSDRSSREDGQILSSVHVLVNSDADITNLDIENAEVDMGADMVEGNRSQQFIPCTNDRSSRQDAVVPQDDTQVDHSTGNNEAQGTNAIDPTFLEALPEELRAEVLASQQAQPVQPPTYVPPSVDDIDPEFLAALPPDIQAEVLAQQRAQRIAQQAEGQPVDMDNASIIATFPAELREEVLLTSSEAVISALPSPLLAEAQMLRDRAMSHYGARSLFGGGHHLTSRRNGLGFDRQTVMDRGVGVAIGRRAANANDCMNLKEIEGDPLLDDNALRALVRLLRLAQPLGKGLLQRLLLNLCAHSVTRATLVRLLLDMIKPEAQGSACELATINPQRLYGCQSNVVYGRSQFLHGLPPLVLRRTLEILTYLATNHSSIAQMLFYLDPSDVPEPSAQETLEAKPDKGKGKIEDGGGFAKPLEDVADIPVVLFLKLLNRPLFLSSIAHLEQVMGLLQVVVYTASSKLECQLRSGREALDSQQQPASESSGNIQENPESSKPESSQDEKAANVESNNSEVKRNVDISDDGNKSALSIFLKLPQYDLRNLCCLLGREGLSEKVYMLAGEVLKKLAAVDVLHRRFFISELSELALSLSSSAVAELVTLRNTNMLGLSAASMAGAATLRVLQSLSSLNSENSSENTDLGSDTEQDQAVLRNLNNALDPLWRELSECISVTEMQLGQSTSTPITSIVNTGEHLQGTTSSLPPVPPGTQRLLPFIEAFFVLCEKLQAHNSLLQQDNANVTAREVKESTVCSSASSALPCSQDPHRKYDGSITFTRFAEKHRRLLNTFVRQNPSLLEKSLSMMLKAPRLIDFDNKRAYFRSRIKQQHEHHLSGPLRISVRRAYVLEDSYNQLRMRSSQDLRGRLNVQFQGEEGIDAGGLTREWYQLLSRVLFDKGALLFTTVGNNSTFQPNSNSVYQTEHLSYFKFVGRVVAKALFDGQLLDVYFTRSFYKHILGVKVTYHDIEAVDPDYYKNLKWLLENDVSDILDLTFSMDPDEEKQILYEKTEVTDYELKPGGRNIRVTEETKHEYVDLVADHILTNAIRPQINSFMEGFSEMVPRELISIFNDKELELLISGLPEIDLDDLKANTEYSGYTAASSVVHWFWEVVKDFSKEDRARLLQFVTGTSKVPLEGFKALQGISGPQKFQIHKAYGAPDRLPSAHTCFNQLDLPEYTSKEQLQERLLLAIHEASEGFGFG